ncbi:MAG: hypothetical protein JWN70_846 [Planctomycetaceae bacterium]|nr:hypothetical protein [Planctomycetaceae bacterium]
MPVLEAGSKMETPPLKSLPLARRPLRARLARWGVLLVIFVAGGVAGYSVGTMRPLESDIPRRGFRPEQFPDILLAKLQKDLTLTDVQTPKVKDLLVRRHKKFDELRIQVQPLFEKAMGDLDREMQAVLTPAQWELYKERRASWHRGGPGRGPGRGGRPPHDDKGPPRGPKPGDHPHPDAPKGESPPKADAPKVEPAVDKPIVEKPAEPK